MVNPKQILGRLLQFTNDDQVKLAEAADLSIYTPVCMPRQADYTGLRATVIGWGNTASNRMPGEPPVTKAVSWLYRLEGMETE